MPLNPDTWLSLYVYTVQADSLVLKRTMVVKSMYLGFYLPASHVKSVYSFSFS